MYQFVRLAGVLLPMTFLLACGGGGGGGGGTAGTPGAGGGMLAPLPEDFPIASRSAAQRLTGGTAPPNLSPARIEAIETARLEAADTVLFTDVLWGSSEGGGTASAPTCVGTICSDIVIRRQLESSTITTRIAANVLADDGETDPNFRTVMVRNGVTLYGTVASEDGNISQQYGGWLDGSIFAFGAISGISSGTTEENTVDLALIFGVAAGNDTGSNPTGTGSASWSGAMVGGLLRSENRIDTVQGDASIDIDDLEAPDVDVVFSNIKNLDAGSDVDAERWNNLTVTNGAFAASDGSLSGSFYGANHAEVGGVFQRGIMFGTFGAARE